jgi:hypothetical protein
MKIFIIVAIILLSSISFANPNAELQVRNDYSFTLVLNVKCGNWLQDLKRFEYEKVFVFPEGKSTTLLVPKKYDKCQIWPSHSW